MADWLLLRLPRVPDQPATWLVVDPKGVATGPPQSGPLSLAAPRSAGRRICVLVPGTDVLVAEPELPTKAGTKLAQLVKSAETGDIKAREQLFVTLYNELHRMAERQLRGNVGEGVQNVTFGPASARPGRKLESMNGRPLFRLSVPPGATVTVDYRTQGPR